MNYGQMNPEYNTGSDGFWPVRPSPMCTCRSHLTSGGLTHSAARLLCTNADPVLAVVSSPSVEEKSFKTSTRKRPSVLSTVAVAGLTHKRKYDAISEVGGDGSRNKQFDYSANENVPPQSIMHLRASEGCNIHKLSDRGGSATFDDCFHSGVSLLDFLDAEVSAAAVDDEVSTDDAEVSAGNETEAVVAAPEEALSWEVLSSLPFHETAIVPWNVAG